jgi:hypothetical protein
MAIQSVAEGLRRRLETRTVSEPSAPKLVVIAGPGVKAHTAPFKHDVGAQARPVSSPSPSIMTGLLHEPAVHVLCVQEAHRILLYVTPASEE